MIVRPLSAALIAVFLSIIFAVTWRPAPWLDPLAIYIFAAAFHLGENRQIYFAFFLSLLIDTLYGLPLGSMAGFYVPLAYIGIRTGKSLTVRDHKSLFLTAIVGATLAHGSWYLLLLFFNQTIVFPFYYTALIAIPFGVCLIWKH